ncbi:MAG: ABC transporter ATP-binding protein [Desulfarculaceae bacterium]|jgi:branched-chain amino acid transport system ATP-binding protein
MALLEVQNLCKEFGGLRANSDISFNMEAGELLGLIGPNGAGKTTLFNCIAGFYPPTSGRIVFEGRDITSLRDFETARLGLARTFQVFQASGDLSVVENVMVGSFLHKVSRARARHRAETWLEFLEADEAKDSLLSELPVAQQKRVALATALASEPRLLLLDEVAAGLNPSEIEGMVELLSRIHREKGIGILVTEHVMEMVMALSQRVLVLESGCLIAEGRPEEVVKDPEVVRAYLGDHMVSREEGESGDA